MRQIDARWIDRSANIEVVWSLDDEGHIVEVIWNDIDRRTLVYNGSDGDVALDAYLHPFVSPKVKHPWETSELVERVAEYAEVGVPI
jgi:hypothetical protein